MCFIETNEDKFKQNFVKLQFEIIVSQYCCRIWWKSTRSKTGQGNVCHCQPVLMVQIQIPAQKCFLFILNSSVNTCEVSQGWISLPVPWMLYVSLLATFQKTLLNWLGSWILHLRSFYASESLSLFIVNAYLIQLNFDLATILFIIG